jgi:hypothetical protein
VTEHLLVPFTALAGKISTRIVTISTCRNWESKLNWLLDSEQKNGSVSGESLKRHWKTVQTL